MMKKVLLIGELSEIVRSLNECLEDEFKVQLCPGELKDVQAMTKIFKPDLMILCRIGIEESDNEILEWMQSPSQKLPAVVITTSERCEECADFYKDKRFAILFRPVAKKELLRKCRQLLFLEDGKQDVKKAVTSKKRWKKKIMIVDDSALLLRNMKGMLERYNYDICLAKSGEQALKLIPEEEPDLILLDYEMEGMDGRCTFEAMKEDEDMRDIPVVFLTSIADRQTVYSVLKSMPDGYILKPPDEERIRETIEEIFAKMKDE